NLAAHVLAAWVLFLLLLRALPLAARGLSPTSTLLLALASALAWAVHPLNTEAVTYLIQRCEVFMGLFFLLTLYLALAGWRSPRPEGWHAAAVGAAFLGMGSKEVMVTAPLAVLAMDWVFQGRRPLKAMKESPLLYGGLAASWGVLAVLWFTAPPSMPMEPFSRESMGRFHYLLTQPEILFHYLRLAVWPHPLVFNYMWKPASLPGALVPAAGMTAILVLSAWGLLRRNPLGFVGVFFFLVLAPSSSFVPLTIAAAEHRMYLPLAAIIPALFTLAWLLANGIPASGPLARGAGWSLALAVCLALGAATHARNQDYQSAVSLWKDTAQKQPHHFWAINDIAASLLMEGRTDEALVYLDRAIAVNPDFAPALFNRAQVLKAKDRKQAAGEDFGRAASLGMARAWVALGDMEKEQGNVDKAREYYQKAAELRPGWYKPQLKLGVLAGQQGDLVQALRRLKKATDLGREQPEAWYNLGVALARTGQVSSAVTSYENVLAINPNHAKALHNLGIITAKNGDPEQAAHLFSRAVASDPSHVGARVNLGRALAMLGKAGEAAAQFEAALSLDPDNATARQWLARVRQTAASAGPRKAPSP
ncbi:MAG: tetratricopeptide repeat protein, partial [Deltaproteobacteria bacterium]|nr:tetratricopeptide repeat protein [Deltaproteobacteria bacterium]